jgi:hypothetical protein
VAEMQKGNPGSGSKWGSEQVFEVKFRGFSIVLGDITI